MAEVFKKNGEIDYGINSRIIMDSRQENTSKYTNKHKTTKHVKV